ncbi:tetratricopeptide repeat protein [Neptunitalea lumnitzerae]|uniref:BatC protein n=1 Tax=Neptunitalea lumnitzerae TaxID=2965509 RepID=A0ABQ5MHD4_9FLAO|nr:tetratricopeptide repeat protein [Neptunitalea sp. Y10]GLB48342.1 BatC protein [Neptunitalea sp. Y10]
MKRLVFIVITMFGFTLSNAQDDKDKELERAKVKSENYTYSANEELKGDAYVEAERSYRKAISDYKDNTTARYNLGTAYYTKETYDEAALRFKETAEQAETKAEKHKAYHNLGNVFMKEKMYQNAVGAYKQALINDPTDDETRYNYALAKKMLEDEQKNGGGDDNDKDKDKNKDQNQEDKKNKNDDKNKNSKKDQGNDEKDEQQNEGKNNEQQKNPDQPKDGQPPEQSKSKASPEQIKRMLRAIEQEDKNVQEKQNTKKVKGIPVKTEKDW